MKTNKGMEVSMTFELSIKDLRDRGYTIHRCWDEKHVVVETPSGRFKKLEWRGIWIEKIKWSAETVHVLESDDQMRPIQTFVA